MAVDRILKTLFSAMVGVMALLYVAHNFANFDQAVAAVGYITSLQGHEIYPNNLLPALPPALQLLAALTVFAGEIAAGVFALWGAWNLWTHRKAGAAEFRAASWQAKLGCGLAVLVWWGLFHAIGGAGYQMWQSPQGDGPFTGSWIYGGISMMVLIYLSIGEPD